MSWLIEDAGHGAAQESVFAVGNGYLGVRGAPEEGAPAYDAGTVLNGFYESWPIVYPEDAYGLARTGQTIVAPPDGSIVRLLVDGEPLDITTARVARVLDMRAGVLRREVEFETPSGARLLVCSRRLASLVHRNLVAIDYEVTVLDGAARVELSLRAAAPRGGDGRRRPAPPQGLRRAAARPGGGRDARLARGPLARHPPLGADARVRDAQRLRRRRLGGDVGRGRRRARRRRGRARHGRLIAAAQVRRLPLGGGHRARRHGRARPPHARPRRRRRLRRRRARPLRARRGVLGAQRHPGRRRAGGPARRALQPLPADAGVPRAPRASACPPRASAAAATRATTSGTPRSTSLPFLIHANPEWAKALLRMRCDMLPAARRRAREVGHRGALFPWRTIDGQEASAWYAAGTAQYHINADVAYGHAPLQPRLGRPRVPARAGRRGAGGDRALLDGARLLLRAPRRAVLHPRGDRPGRVHDRGRRQRVHQPARARRTSRSPRASSSGSPPPTRARTPRSRASWRSPPTRSRAGAARPSACTCRATRGSGSCSRTSASSSASAGTSRARRARSTRCCCTSTRSSSTATR